MDLSGSTRLLGVIGHPIRHTLSPQMHNAAFAASGLDYVYLPMEVRPVDLAAAEVSGAVNTVVIEESGLRGANTDVSGFVDACREAGVSLEEATVLVVGAGG